MSGKGTREAERPSGAGAKGENFAPCVVHEGASPPYNAVGTTVLLERTSRMVLVEEQEGIEP